MHQRSVALLAAAGLSLAPMTFVTAQSVGGPYGGYMTGLDACFGAAEDRPMAEACIGIFANECMARAPDGQTTVGMSGCLMAEAEAWDTILNIEYRTALSFAATLDAQDGGGLPQTGTRVDQVRQAQRAWIPFRDANCAMAYGLWGAGSMRQIAGAECRMAMTAQRAIDLNFYARTMEGQ